MAPVKNRFLYVYRIFAKVASFAYFGIASFFLSILILPLMSLLIHPADKFKLCAHKFIYFSFKGFVFFMRVIGAAKLCTSRGDRERFKNLHSKIITANHPSLLDVVMLISLIPNADCIVNAALAKTVVRGIVLRVYILNSLDFDVLCGSCIESLKKGNCLIIFPEGTRTVRGREPVLKRGAAHLAARSNCSIVPVHIGGTDKYGLGKKEPLLSYNHSEEYIYEISIKDEIDPAKYSELPVPIQARRITEELKKTLFPISVPCSPARP